MTISNDEVTRYLKKKTKNHKVKKHVIFDYEDLVAYVQQPCEDLVTQQDFLIAIFSFYLLGKFKILEILMLSKFFIGRSEETANITVENVFFIDDETGIVGVNLQRCSKNRLVTKGFVHPPDGFNVAAHLKKHLESIPMKTGCLWWQPNSLWSGFVGQHFGKNQILKIAKNIAVFVGKPAEDFGSHSFCCSGATAMANASATYEQIMMADGWTCVNIAHTYVQESDHSASACACLLLFKWTPSSAVRTPTLPAPTLAPVHPVPSPCLMVNPPVAPPPASLSSAPPFAVFSGCTFSGVTFTPEFMASFQNKQ